VIDRRSFLAGTGGMLALAGLGLGGCSRPATRPEVLAGLVERITVPDCERIVRDSRALDDAVKALGKTPAPDAVTAARDALRAAILSWQRAYAFRMGPLVDSHALLRASFWPVRPSSIAGHLRGTRPIDAALLAEFGVDVKGLFALEHLLFEGPEPGASWLADAQLPRVLQMMRAIAADVRGHAERAANELGDGSAFAKKLADGGQESLNKLVNELLATVETASSSRLDRVLAMQRDGTLKASDVQGAPSGLSAAIPRVWLEVSSALYDRDGHGLGELVRQSAPAIDPRVREAFARSTRELDTLDAPLELLVKKDAPRLERSVRAMKDLEVAIKADLASALGVTLTFTSSDGD
jgi:predicted lipoprotein